VAPAISTDFGTAVSVQGDPWRGPIAELNLALKDLLRH